MFGMTLAALSLGVLALSLPAHAQEAAPAEDPVVAIVDGTRGASQRGRGGGTLLARTVSPGAAAADLRHASGSGDRLPSPGAGCGADRSRARSRRPGAARAGARRRPAGRLRAAEDRGRHDRGQAARALRGGEGRRGLHPGGGPRAPHPGRQRGRGEGGDRRAGGRRRLRHACRGTLGRSFGARERRRPGLLPTRADGARVHRGGVRPPAGAAHREAGPDPVRLACHRGAWNGARARRPSRRRSRACARSWRARSSSPWSPICAATPRSSASISTARRCRSRPNLRKAGPRPPRAAAPPAQPEQGAAKGEPKTE